MATGETHSVRDFREIGFAEAGLDYKDWVVVDERFYRPVEVHVLTGSPAKARTALNWESHRGFKELIAENGTRGLGGGRHRNVKAICSSRD